MKKYFAPLLAVTCLTLSIWSVACMAQTASVSSQGLSISPFLLERKMNKGESTSEIIDITNTSDKALPVDITVNDFQPTGDNGQQEFLNPGQGDPHYSLSSWIHITSNPKPILQPGEKTSLNFTITAPADADDGGHYGAILFSFQGGPVSGTAVAVQQKIGAIILVKLGKTNEAGNITKFGAATTFSEYLPINFFTTFQNTGNVHVQPRGSIAITNMFGRQVASVQVNENANNVLPNSARQFQSTWKNDYAFGFYHATVQLIYGDSGQIVTASTSFWVIPWKLVLIIGLILFILLIALTTGVRRYNRWLLNKALNAKKK